jgi:hypothetical protein
MVTAFSQWGVDCDYPIVSWCSSSEPPRFSRVELVTSKEHPCRLCSDQTSPAKKALEIYRPSQKTEQNTQALHNLSASVRRVVCRPVGFFFFFAAPPVRWGRAGAGDGGCCSSCPRRLQAACFREITNLARSTLDGGFREEVAGGRRCPAAWNAGGRAEPSRGTENKTRGNFA